MTEQYPDPKHRPIWRPPATGGDLDVNSWEVQVDIPYPENGFWVCLCGKAVGSLSFVNRHIEHASRGPGQAVSAPHQGRGL